MCREVLNQLHDETVKDKIQDGVYTTRGGYQSYKEDMKRLEEKYEDILGSMAVKVLLRTFYICAYVRCISV